MVRKISSSWLEPQRDAGLGDEVRDVGADHVARQDLVVLGLGHDLDQPAVVPDDARLGDVADGKRPILTS